MTIEWAQVTTGLFSWTIFSAVGLVVLMRGGPGRVPKLFGWWLIVWGLSEAMLFVGGSLGIPTSAGSWASGTLYVALAGLTAALVMCIPAHVGIRERDAWPWFAGWGALMGAAAATGFAQYDMGPVNWFYGAGIVGIQVASTAGLCWFAVLGRRTDRRTATHLLAVSVAIAAWPLLAAGGAIHGLAAPSPWRALVHASAMVAGAAVPIALWVTGPHVRLRTRGPNLILGFVVLGQVLSTSLVDQGLWFNIAYVIAMVAMAGYALFHDRFVKLDLGLRWTISRGTLPSLVVVAFFVASEGAQEFFGERAGNEYVGIAAAGILLLTMRPLQVVADRAAARAVPGVPTVQPFADPGEIFRMAVRAAMLDGRLTGPEELELARLQERLRLSAQVAALTRVEVAHDLGHS